MKRGGHLTFHVQMVAGLIRTDRSRPGKSGFVQVVEIQRIDEIRKGVQALRLIVATLCLLDIRLGQDTSLLENMLLDENGNLCTYGEGNGVGRAAVDNGTATSIRAPNSPQTRTCRELD